LLIRLVVFPPDRIATLSACDVSYDMPAGCHVTFHRFGRLDVDDIGEEEGFAVLAAEVLPDMVISSAIQSGGQ
jgi:hypothetical protein